MMEVMFCLMVILGSSYTEQQPLLSRAAVEASNALVQCLAPAWLASSLVLSFDERCA